MLTPKRLSLVCALFVCLIFVGFARAGGDEWREVTPAELQMKTPKVEADADAEAIFWEVRIDDKKYDKLTYEHYVRVKIFTEKGREKFAKFDISFEKGNKVEDIAARVINPDGSIVELNPKDIFEQEVIKTDKLKIRSKSFAIPGIAPGVIVEYRYRETLKNADAGGRKLIFQRDIPVQQMAYFVRPAKNADLRAIFYNMPETRFTAAEDGFYVVRASNVPAFREEPYMPPVDQARQWALLRYSTFDIRSFFMDAGFQTYVERVFKAKGKVKDKAEELVAGVTSDEDKLHKIYAFVQGIKNLGYDPTWTKEQIEKQKINEPEDVLKKSAGTEFVLDLLFAALAHDAGMEASIVLTGDRSKTLYGPNDQPKTSELHFAGVAVKTAKGYLYFNPGIPYMPYGSIFWFEEDVPAYMIGDGNGHRITTTLSSYEASVAHRTGKFELSADGTIEGTVKLEYSGQQGIARRRNDFLDTPAEKEETIKNEIKALSSTAEISEIKIENFQDGSKPLTYTLKVRIPNYAQKTGKRLFLQPGFFEYGTTSAFSANDRKFSIWFTYPWSEIDDVDIKLPKGYALDSADSPADVVDANKVGSQKIRMRIDSTNNILKMHRDFYFGGSGIYVVPATAYPAIKEMFGAFQIANTHIITLKQTGN